MEVSSHEDSASEFCRVGPIFSMKLLGFVSKAIKLLLARLRNHTLKPSFH